MKQAIIAGLAAVGLEVRRLPLFQLPRPASTERPIANIRSFLEDVQARGFTPEGILDVGAHRGDWTRMALSIYPQATVVMIEPLEQMCAPLSALCGERPGCHHVKVAAGRAETELIQTMGDDHDLGWATFLPDPNKSPRQKRTQVVTIDSILAKYTDFRPDLVKIDIQGFELEALSGGSKLFGMTELFVIETSLFSFMERQPMTRDVISFMADRRYEIYDITEFVRRPYDGALGQLDIAFVKRDGFLRPNDRWNTWDAVKRGNPPRRG
jgi:FkbM family methyltransferase